MHFRRVYYDTPLTSWLMGFERYREAQEAFLSFDRIVDEGLFKQFSWYQDLIRFKSYQLTAKSVIIVDEAGMIGTRQWHALLEQANRVGAKVIAVGDDNQFKAIEGGDFFREMKEQSKSNGRLFYLSTIRRQRIDWMKDASHLLAELHTTEGLSLYEHKGHIHRTEHNADLAENISEAYVARLAQGEINGLVLAFTNTQTHLLNQAIRQKLREASIPGHFLSPKDVFTLPKNGAQEAKSFAIGDKLVFLKNNKDHVMLVSTHGEIITDRSVKNGTVGVLEAVCPNGKQVVVRLDKDTTAHFDLSEYSHISHGYAVTCHKSQGQTVDFTLVAASKYMDAKGVYVAMTRHRNDVQLYYSHEDFKDVRALSLHLSRFHHKDLVKDYTIHPDNLEAWHRVQEYQHCIYDAAALRREANTEGSPDWPAYHAVKQGYIELGREILNDFESHKFYLHQAGLTEENLLISTGRKARTLTEAETKANLRVTLYGEAAQQARDLWKTIKHTRPSNQHPKFKVYQELRSQRDTLAHEILDNYPLHRDFVNRHSRHFGISKKTLESQVAYRNQQQHKNDLSFIKEAFDFKLDTQHSTTIGGSESSPSRLRKHRQTHEVNKKSRSISFERTSAEIVNDLNTHVKDLALHFLGKPTQQNARQWRFGKKGSLALSISGTSKGMYTNFETGVSGNIVTFIADQLNVTKKEAFKWGLDWLGYEHAHAQNGFGVKTPRVQKENLLLEINASKDTWAPLFPVHPDFPDLRNTASLAYLLKGRTEIARYPYTDADENILGYVLRLEDKEGVKITPTLTYCQNAHGITQWRWKGFGENRPLYGLNQLALKPNAPVLIVEGEKTCEAARILFPEYAVITWSGGCGSVHKTDWSPLAKREVIIWPDHDNAGLNAALKIGDHLAKEGNNTLYILDLPSTLPHKWDLADQTPDGVEVASLMSYAKSYIELSYTHEQKHQPRYERTFSYAEIKEAAEHERIAGIISEEDAPFMEHSANEAYKEIQHWRALTRLPLSEKEQERQALLTSIYTTRLKSMLDEHEKDPDVLEKSHHMGVLAAHRHIKGDMKHANDCMFKAIDTYESREKMIKQHLDNPPEAIKQSTKEIQEALIRTAARYNTVTEKNMPPSLTKELFDHIQNICPDERNIKVIQGVMKHVASHKIKGEPSHELFSLEKIRYAVKQQQFTHHLSLEQSHQKALHMEHMQREAYELNRGFERSL